MLEYRPTPKQRSTLELLQYMAIMGPTQLTVIEQGIFDRPTLNATWSPEEADAKKMSFDQAITAIGQQSDEYARRLGAWTDTDFRKEVDMFGRKSSRGLLVVTLVPRIPHPIVHLPQSLRPRRAEHDEPPGRHRHAGKGIARHIRPSESERSNCTAGVRTDIAPRRNAIPAFSRGLAVSR
jgi:hypothetical protein